MTTSLSRFADAYATMTVAVYQPLIVRWFSGWTIKMLADTMAWRLDKGKRMSPGDALSTAHGVIAARTLPRPSPARVAPESLGRVRAVDLFREEAVRRVALEGYPDAVEVGGIVYPSGVVDIRPTAASRFEAPAAAEARDVFDVSSRMLPTMVNRRLGTVAADFDLRSARNTLLVKMVGAVREAAAAPDRAVAEFFSQSLLDVGGHPIYAFFPPGRIEEALSPIGIAHYYRQHYFNAGEGFGPIEEAFTVAPLETLEVVYETIRRQIHEEQVEVGVETVGEASTEVKNIDEISDKVSAMIHRDTTASMSANASGSVGVWSGGASVETGMAISTERSREDASRHLKEVTRRASERITKTFSLRTRNVEEFTTTNLTRRTIRNESPEPVSYGLRRVLRKVRVKIQDLGPRLVWQLYVRNPGAGLARSRFVHFADAQPISVPYMPPGLRAEPVGGVETGTTTAAIDPDEAPVAPNKPGSIRIAINPGKSRNIRSVHIDSISDLEGGGKDDEVPVPIDPVGTPPTEETPGSGIYISTFRVRIGDTASVRVDYSYVWEPSDDEKARWETDREAAATAAKQVAWNEQFERQRAQITQRSKIRARPANDLRREERYEVLNRMISHVFGRGDDPSEPSPLEIEYFHRYFDVEAMFVYTHPSWWIPRYSPVGTALPRIAYEITDESDPAPLGRSLGWEIQDDGDARRNEFLNSPWVRVCLPIGQSREREALDWLAKHIEGEIGYRPDEQPLADVLTTIAARRQAERTVGVGGGPEYVTVTSTVGAPPQPVRPENVYPIIDEFDVTLPTDGFVYDRLELTQP